MLVCFFKRFFVAKYNADFCHLNIGMSRRNFFQLPRRAAPPDGIVLTIQVAKNVHLLTDILLKNLLLCLRKNTWHKSNIYSASS
jgi:hypothetical protein